MAQQDGHGVHVTSRGQHLTRKAALPAVTGAFDACTLVKCGDVRLQIVASLVVAELASF